MLIGRIVIVLSLFAACGFAQPKPHDAPVAPKQDLKVDLTPDLSVGKEFDFSWSWESKDHFYPEGSQECASTAFWHLNRSYHFTVENMDSDGVASISATITRIAYRLKSPEESVQFDTRKPLDGQKDSPIRIFGEIPLGKTFTFEVTSKGEVRNLKGVGAIRKAILDAKPDPQWDEVLDFVFEDSRILEQLQGYFDLYAFREIQVGDEWERTRATERKTTDMIYTLQQVDQKRRVVVVAFSGKQEANPNELHEESSLSREMRRSRLNGRVIIDLDSKQLVRGTRKVDTVWDVVWRQGETKTKYRIEDRGLLTFTSKPAPDKDRDSKPKRITKKDGGKYNITPGFHVGDELRFKTSQSKKVKMEFEQAPSIVTTELEVTYFVIRVEEELSGGGWKMRLVFTDVEYFVQNQREVRKFDSRAYSASDMNTDDGKYWLSWINKSIVFDVSSRGEVSNFHGIKELQDDVLKHNYESRLDYLLEHKLESSFLEGVIKSLFSIYPFRSVAIGEKWDKVIEMQESKTFMSARTSVKNTFIGKTQKKGAKAAEIETMSKLEYKLKEKYENTKVLENRGMAKTWLEEGTGKVVYSRGQSVLKAEYSLASPDSSQKMLYTVESESYVIQDPQE